MKEFEKFEKLKILKKSIDETERRIKMTNLEIIEAVREKSNILNEKNNEIGDIKRAINIVKGYAQTFNKYDEKWTVGNALQIGYISKEDHKLIMMIAVNAWEKTLERLNKEFTEILNTNAEELLKGKEG